MKYIDLNLVKEKIGSGYHFEGISCHRGVILLIGERSYPDRTIEWLDTLNQYVLNQLIAVHDWKGGLYLFWEKIPNAFIGLTDIEIPDGDVWTVYEQITPNGITENQ